MKKEFLDINGLSKYDSLIKNYIDVVARLISGKYVADHASAEASDSELGHVKVDSSLSDESENPVQNKVITSELNLMRDEYGNLLFQGTQAEYDAANAQGLIKEGTIVNITDDYDDDSIGSNYFTSSFDSTTITFVDANGEFIDAVDISSLLTTVNEQISALNTKIADLESNVQTVSESVEVLETESESVVTRPDEG